MSKKNSHKDRVGIVYSTASDFDYTTDQEEEADTLPVNQQVLSLLWHWRQCERWRDFDSGRFKAQGC